MALPFDWDSQRDQLIVKSKWSVRRYAFMTLYIFSITTLRFFKCIQAFNNGDTKKFAFGLAQVCVSTFIWIIMFILALQWKHVQITGNTILWYFRELYGKSLIIMSQLKSMVWFL